LNDNSITWVLFKKINILLGFYLLNLLLFFFFLIKATSIWVWNRKTLK